MGWVHLCICKCKLRLHAILRESHSSTMPGKTANSSWPKLIEDGLRENGILYCRQMSPQFKQFYFGNHGRPVLRAKGPSRLLTSQSSNIGQNIKLEIIFCDGMWVRCISVKAPLMLKDSHSFIVREHWYQTGLPAVLVSHYITKRQIQLYDDGYPILFEQMKLCIKQELERISLSR